MTFEEEIQPIARYLCANGFKIVEQHNLFIELVSVSTRFVFSKDPREQVSSIYVGKKNSIPNILSDEIYERIFSEDFNSTEQFPQNFINFLKNKGKKLVDGDKETLNAIEKISSEEAERYTKEIINSQQLNQLEDAWQTNDYTRFILLMENTDQNILPNFYKLRFNIARKRL